MARRKRERLSVERWSQDAASVWTGMADWRAAHPKATFTEIEAALDERLERRPTPEPVGPDRLQVSADGAMISLVGKQWVEVKTLAVVRVVQAADGTVRTTDLSYFSRRAKHTAFRRLALVETYRRGVGTALEVAAVLDGADWLKRFVDFHRPDAIRILDFPHAVEYLTRASHEAFGAGTAATSEWPGSQAHALKHAGPDSVLAALRALPPGEQRDTALGYLEPRLAQVQYPTFRARGYAIGSGIVESAKKVVVQDRLKGAGCTGRQTMSIRSWPCAPSSVPTAGTRPGPRSPLASVPTPAPKTMIAGRPTSAHPWKRRFLPHRPVSPARN